MVTCMKMIFHLLRQRWPGPLVRPLLTGLGLEELGGWAFRRNQGKEIFHQRVQVTSAGRRSVCAFWVLSSQTLLSSDWQSFCPTASAGPWKCPSSAASCLNVGNEYISLGQVESAPSWDNGLLKLQYSSGQVCPEDRSRKRTSIIRFKCEKDKVVRRICFCFFLASFALCLSQVYASTLRQRHGPSLCIGSSKDGAHWYWIRKTFFCLTTELRDVDSIRIFSEPTDLTSFLLA